MIQELSGKQALCSTFASRSQVGPLAIRNRGGAMPPRRQAAQPAPLTTEQQALVAANIGLVGVHIRNRVRCRRRPVVGREYDDLFQTGCLALVNAARRYEPSRDGPFGPYALLRIRRAIHVWLLSEAPLVHVPYGKALGSTNVRCGRTEPPGRRLARENLTADPIDTRLAAGETLRHGLRRRFERAVPRALEALAAENRRRTDPSLILARIASERVLIGDPREQTPIRDLAREFRISSGRICEHEKRLLREIGEQMRRDPQVRLLNRMARFDLAGLDGPLTPQRRRKLLLAEMRAFDRRFARLGAPERAGVLYSLVERTTGRVPEVASNLFRLTLESA